MQADVAVVGLGAMGSAALWRLASRGASVVGFEQYEPGHDQGSSHGESRIIRSAYYEGPQYVPLVFAAFELWRQLERESGVDLLTMTGALMLGSPERDLIVGTLASARAHGLSYELLDAATLQRRYPQFRLRSDEVAVHEQQAGILRPEAAVRAMVAQAEQAGATVYRRSRVERIDAVGDGVEITAGGATHRARHAVIAAGAWLPRLVPDLRLPLQVERQVMAWFPADVPAHFSPARAPVFMHEIAPGRFRYGFPTLDGTTVKIGIHHDGADTTAAAVDRAVHTADLEPLRRYIRDRLHGVGDDVARSTVCLYTNTPDEHFVIGAAPGRPALTVLSPCSGHGFKFAPVIGDAAADLALSGATAYPIAGFAPGRFVETAEAAETA